MDDPDHDVVANQDGLGLFAGQDEHDRSLFVRMSAARIRRGVWSGQVAVGPWSFQNARVVPNTDGSTLRTIYVDLYRIISQGVAMDFLMRGGSRFLVFSVIGTWRSYRNWPLNLEILTSW